MPWCSTMSSIRRTGLEAALGDSFGPSPESWALSGKGGAYKGYHYNVTCRTSCNSFCTVYMAKKLLDLSEETAKAVSVQRQLGSMKF